MEAQQLKDHLEQLHKQLITLLKSYDAFKVKTRRKEKELMVFLRHFINLIIIILIIVSMTYMISVLLVDAREFVIYIASFQIVLASILYIFFMLKIKRDMKKEQIEELIHLSVFELDQMRFQILQNLASSPISQNYITPTSIKIMIQLIESGRCSTIEECIRGFEKVKNKEKHEEELKLIGYLQTTSFH